jgi:hypothetical protein
MKTWRRHRSGRYVAVLSILVAVSMLAVSLAQITSSGVSVAQARGTAITTSSQAGLARLHPALRDTARARPDSSVIVHAYIQAGTDLSELMPDALQRAWVAPNGLTIATGTVSARNLAKLANLPGVVAIDPMTGGYAPAGVLPMAELQAAPQPDAALRASMTERIQSGQRNNEQFGARDVQPAGWYDVLNTHHSAAVWEMGFTGAGVKVMVNDSGVDFTHPDLMGTWAVVEDPNSPYFGWPMQFDAYSMYLHARDVVLGESNIASGEGHYADTSTVITEAAPTYQPLDSDEPYTYTLTGTSQSGNYHIGTHPDTSLRPWYYIATGQEQPEGEEGQRPAILVVDESAPGVYDTVYVDLDFDNDFSDEKPMTRADPIAGADWWGAFDPETGEYDPEPDGSRTA